MTQHLTVNSSIFPSAIDNRYPVRMYHTACGRLVTAAQASGPAGVTCRACKNTDAWREAT